MRSPGNETLGKYSWLTEWTSLISFKRMPVVMIFLATKLNAGFGTSRHNFSAAT
jgi:hypothetical protein